MSIRSRWLPPALRRQSRARLRVESLEDRVNPATIPVTSSMDDGSAGTLRAAIDQANMTPEADTIDIQVTDPILLTFNSNLPLIRTSLTIQGKGALTTRIVGNLSRPFTIDGGATQIAVTISGLTIQSGNAAGAGPADTVFDKGGAIANKGDDTVTVRGVTFTESLNATEGGAVFNGGGTLVLESCTFTKNTSQGGGAVSSIGGTVTVTACTFGGPAAADGNTATNAGDGGAILATNATLTITGSTFRNNSADFGDGGAVFVTEQMGGSAAATIANSAFDNNAAEFNGGAIAVTGTATLTVAGSAFVQNSAQGSGGGLSAVGGPTVAVTNSTFGKNTAQFAGGGIAMTTGGTVLTLRSSTLAFNQSGDPGGGLSVTAGTAKLFNTLVAKNTNQQISGTIDPASTGNVIGTKDGLANTAALAANGNKIGGEAPSPAEIDPLFDSNLPAFNGGFTRTYRLPATSPAKDAGAADTGGLTVDQRGGPFVRVNGSAIDAGAYEIQDAVREYVVNTVADRSTPGVEPDSLSLREALVLVGPDAPTVRFDPALNGQTITLTLGALRIDKAVMVVGPGADKLTLSGNDQSRVFIITEGNNGVDLPVTLSGLTITNGVTATGDGGGIYTQEALTLDKVVVRNSRANQGGGVMTEGGTLTITSSTISGNTANLTAGSRGGGIYIANGGVGAEATLIRNSTISGNTANGVGGGIHMFVGELRLFNSTVTDNKAGANDTTNATGGGIRADGATTIVGSIIAGNKLGAVSTEPDISGTARVNFSLIGNLAGFTPAAGSGSNVAPANATDTLNAKLGPLSNNGGPTPTHLPAADSPAVDPGFADSDVNPPPALAADQRGRARAFGAGVDLGAVEFGLTAVPSILTDFVPRTTTPGTAITVPFTVADADTPLDQLTIFATADNATLVPAANLVVTGTGADRVLTVTPAAGQTGMALISVTVRDPDNGSDVKAFTLTVTATPGDTTPPTIAPDPIPNVAAVVGNPITPIQVTVGDNVTAAGSIVVTAASSNAGLVTVAVSGTGATRTLTFSPVAGQTGTATITVNAADAASNVASRTFTVTINPVGSDTTPPTIAPDPIPNVTVTVGQAIAPITLTVADNVSAAANVTVTATSSNAGLVTGTVTGTGATRTLTLTPVSGQTGTATITVTATDQQGNALTRTFTVTVNPTGGTQPLLVGFPQFAAGADVGSGQVIFYNPDKSVRFTVEPFAGFTGGVRTAAADFNNDGVADLVVGTGPGRATRVVVLDGKTQAQLFSVDPFEASFTGGVYVAAGDVDGDGRADLVITPDEGGGPRCDVYSGNGFVKISSFFGIEDPNFRGGARSAVGDVNGDGFGDLVVAAGFQGGPRVAAFSGKSLSSTPVKLFNDFFAFEQTLRNGVFIATGDLDGDGKAEIIAGGGPGGGPRITAFSAADLIDSGGGTLTQLANFFGGNPDSRGGIRPVVKDLDGDAKADIVVGAGSGAGSRVTAYLGKTIAPAGTPAAAFDFDAFPGFTGGVFVG